MIGTVHDQDFFISDVSSCLFTNIQYWEQTPCKWKDALRIFLQECYVLDRLSNSFRACVWDRKINVCPRQLKISEWKMTLSSAANTLASASEKNLIYQTTALGDNVIKTYILSGYFLIFLCIYIRKSYIICNCISNDEWERTYLLLFLNLRCPPP